MVKRCLEILLLLPFLGACQLQEDTDIFPAWQIGELEIAQIYTVRGATSFLISPVVMAILFVPVA